jgi:hypothetical protein
MRSSAIVMANPFTKQPSKMLVAERDKKVQALAAPSPH